MNTKAKDQKLETKETKTTEKSEVALREEEVLAFWREHDIFNKTLERPGGVDVSSSPVEASQGAGRDFVFYDGPPFATGTPHYGHILAGTIKDAIPRYQTMRGKRVVRKWGWDCHGLPLENIIEKRLGLATKRDIEEMGVKQFNEAARGAVMEYEEDWKEVVPRMGRFVDMEHDYKTMDSTYTESVWWVFSELSKKGLVYEGFKSMHLCPRCGTTLSNFEVNQGYKDIKDIAVTVKMPLLDDEGNVTDTSLLIWTTTPWTLPGNMAIAINRDIEYVKIKVDTSEEVQVRDLKQDGSYGPATEMKEEFVIVAKVRLSQLGTDAYEILEEMRGDALVGKRYAPPFTTLTSQEFKNKENAWKVYHADYVSTEDGTGAVHIAPAYGEDDMELAKRENIPLMHHVDEDGRFKACVTEFAGQLVKPKDDEDSGASHLDADIEVVKYLKEKEVLVRKENITHSYPHCWRCNTPLLNYATTSWFVRVTDFKDALVAENAKIKWVPEHVGTNRFGKWLEGARDWAVSRQRYWGAPLPIWKREDTGEAKILGSLEDIKQYIPKSGNTYYIVRHGESELNTKEILSSDMNVVNGLTEKGKEQVRGAVSLLRSAHIDVIYYSPLPRTYETALMIAEELGLTPEDCIPDMRLREMGFGEFEGKDVHEYLTFFGSGYNRLVTRPENGESWGDVKKRVGEFMYEIDREMSGKNVLIVGHNGPLEMLQAVAKGIERETLGGIIERDELDIGNACVREIEFSRLPHNDDYELDFHRPYIDEVELRDTDGAKLVRIPDVFDCWFESGSMPYGQHHYPFENKEMFLKEKYPADFIAEGLDQTRGWFYSLIVLGVALFGKSPYKHVIVNGLTLAEDGKKMSKSLQNYPDPMELADRVGVDALRYYLLSSPIVRGEDLAVSEKEVLEVQRKNIGRLHNVLAMYEMYQTSTNASSAVLPSSLESSSYIEYASLPHSSSPSTQGLHGGLDVDGSVESRSDSTHVLDRWIIARLNQVIAEVTSGYESYELDRATRPIEGLIDDISVWYLRRSRERLKNENIIDKEATLATLRYVLKNLALVMAPVMPFYAEYLFQRMKEGSDAESVHLAPWPKGGDVDPVVLGEMSIVREFVTLALEQRTKANIKVRQPLSELRTNIELEPAYASIVADEINVKAVMYDASLTERVALSTTITPELKHEGNVRELMRAIQDARKEMGLKQEDRIILVLDEHTKALMGEFEGEVLRTIGAREARADSSLATRTITIDGSEYRFGIEKV